MNEGNERKLLIFICYLNTAIKQLCSDGIHTQVQGLCGANHAMKANAG